MNQNKIMRNLAIVVIIITCITIGVYLNSTTMGYSVPVTSWTITILSGAIACYLLNKYNKKINKDE